MKLGWIARQSRRPSGWIGEVVARLMERETRPANAFALAQLGPGADDDVLEIGCGTGRCLERLSRRGPTAHAAGIDPSGVMVRIATRRLRRQIERGRVEVRRAEASRLPFAAASFDAALAVHVLYFWPDPGVELREVRRILRPGGVLVLGFRPDDPRARAALPATVYHLRTTDEVEALLRGSGFEDVQIASTNFDGAPFACLRARARGQDAGPHQGTTRTGSCE